MKSRRCANHTPCPTSYVAWFAWARHKSRHHKQVRCEECGRFAIWVPRRKDQRQLFVHPPADGGVKATVRA